MISLNNVNKYFNRHKKNEIHVINNSTISFDDTGLVAILGNSGSGKTTLLNAIGGLDKVNSGSIYINGEKITRKSSHKIDEIRNLNIGYIFQDYKLVETMTVFENVQLSLKIIGIKDKEEIEKRVMYALEKVNMARFKNRPASMLSGGEKQRVGIARALVKNPKIIIADEPTGNLDSKNSLEVMNIIKSLSKKYLVILVTHEEALARFYASKIVELKDGVIDKFYDNKNVGSLNYKIENRLYLKDFQDISNVKGPNINVDVYRDDNEKLNITVVFKNGNIYIENKGNEKIEIVENNSHIELIDDHYKELEDNDVSIDYNIESVSNSNFKPKYSSIFKLTSFISYGIKKILDYPILKKILLIGFFLSGMFIFYSISTISATLNVEDKNFIKYNKEYLTAYVNNLSVDTYREYENGNNIDYILPSDSIIYFRKPYDKYLQSSGTSGVFGGSLSNISDIKEDDLKYGRMPNNDYEIVIDAFVLENFINNSSTNMVGYNNVQDFLNEEVNLKNMDDFTIVGITDLNEPNIYAKKDMFINMLANTFDYSYDYYGTTYDDIDNSEITILDYNLVNDKKIKLVKGRLPINDYEVIIKEDNFEDLLNKEIDIKINNHKLKVVGYYQNTTEQYLNYYLVNNNMIKYDLINRANYLSIKSLNKEDTINYFLKEKVNIKDSYDYTKNEYLKLRKDNMISTLILSGVILGISLIEILLMIRSSFLSRIKEVGIYRAIGVKKSDIYKMFAGEILVITVIASFTGILFMSYILHCIRSISYLDGFFMVNILTIGISILLVLIFNLVAGLLPVFNTIRKTPAEILARFDVD